MSITMSSETLPLVLIVNCAASGDDSAAASLLSELLNLSNSNTPSLHCTSGIIGTTECHRLRLETKYYHVTTLLCRADFALVGKELSVPVEAVILYYDAEVDTYLDRVKECDAWLSQWNPQIKLLVCNNVDESKRENTVKWCIENEFELVELSPKADSVEEAEECGEVLGFKRILQALSSHTWPTMIMKDPDNHLQHLKQMLELGVANQDEKVDLKFDDNFVPNIGADCTPDGTQCISAAMSSLGVSGVNVSSASGANNSDASAYFKGLLDAEVAVTQLEGCAPDSEQDDFDQLFSRLWEMKQKCVELPSEQRKLYAEHVVKAYWQAIGGDENELAGLDSDSEAEPD